MTTTQPLGLLGSAIVVQHGLFATTWGGLPPTQPVSYEEVAGAQAATKAFAQALPKYYNARNLLLVQADTLSPDRATSYYKGDLTPLDRIGHMLDGISTNDYRAAASKAAATLVAGGYRLLNLEEFALETRQRVNIKSTETLLTRAKQKPEVALELAHLVMQTPEIFKLYANELLSLAKTDGRVALAVAYLASKFPDDFPKEAIKIILAEIGASKLPWIPLFVLEATMKNPWFVEKMIRNMDNPKILGLSWALYFLVKIRQKETAKDRKLVLALSSTGFYNGVVRHAHHLVKSRI